MAKKLRKKHIFAKWRIAIVGFLLVAVALLIPLFSENQTLRTEASANFTVFFSPNYLKTEPGYTSDIYLRVRKNDQNQNSVKWTGPKTILLQLRYNPEYVYSGNVANVKFTPSSGVKVNEQNKEERRFIADGDNSRAIIYNLYTLNITIDKSKKFTNKDNIIGKLRIKTDKYQNRSFEIPYAYELNGSPTARGSAMGGNIRISSVNRSWHTGNTQ